MKLVVWHLEAVECLDGQDIKPYAAVDEGLGDLYAAIGRAPAVAAHLSWSAELKVMAHLDHMSGRVASSLGRIAFTSRANCLKNRCEARA